MVATIGCAGGRTPAMKDMADSVGQKSVVQGTNDSLLVDSLGNRLVMMQQVLTSLVIFQFQDLVFLLIPCVLSSLRDGWLCRSFPR